jgi:hypothetical protein
MLQARITRQRAKPPQRQRPVVLSPSAAFPPLGDDQVAMLRRIGEKWSQALGHGRRPRLPVDPGLHVSTGRSSPGAAALWRSGWTAGAPAISPRPSR